MRMPLPGGWKLAGRVAIVAVGVVAGMLLPNLAEALAVAASVLAVLTGLSSTESQTSRDSERSNLPQGNSEAVRRDDNDVETLDHSAHGSGDEASV
jgi:hypothetical protein